ncbi:MAG: hypothetical protein AAFR38_09245 [Planctomycetota bacterium]
MLGNNLRLMAAAGVLGLGSAGALGQNGYDLSIVLREGQMFLGEQVTSVGGFDINDRDEIVIAGATSAGGTLWSRTGVLLRDGVPTPEGVTITSGFNWSTVQLNNSGTYAVAVFGPNFGNDNDHYISGVGLLGMPGKQLDGETLSGADLGGFELADDGLLYATGALTDGRTVLFNQSEILLKAGEQIDGETVAVVGSGGANENFDINSSGYWQVHVVIAPGTNALASSTGLEVVNDRVGPTGQVVTGLNNAEVAVNDSGDYTFAASFDNVFSIAKPGGIVISDGEPLPGVTDLAEINQFTALDESGDVVFASDLSSLGRRSGFFTPNGPVALPDQMVDGFRLLEMLEDSAQWGPNGKVYFVARYDDGSRFGSVAVIEATPRPASCSAADVAAPFGVISQADVSEFVDLFFAGDSRVAALAGPIDIVSQADVNAFVGLFFAGCPTN